MRRITAWQRLTVRELRSMNEELRFSFTPEQPEKTSKLCFYSFRENHDFIFVIVKYQIFIHTNHSRFILEGLAEAFQICL
jgi:hypothetical protein